MICQTMIDGAVLVRTSKLTNVSEPPELGDTRTLLMLPMSLHGLYANRSDYLFLYIVILHTLFALRW